MVTTLLSDPIADYLTRIRNAIAAEHETVEVPASRLKAEMTRILKEQGYVSDYSLDPAPVGEVLRIRPAYTEQREPVITGLERISRPGRRRYVSSAQIPRVMGGMGTAIISTSQGVMTGHEARAKGIGGEVVAYVW